MKRTLTLFTALALTLSLAIPAAQGAEAALPDLSEYPDLQVTWMPGYELPPYYGVSSEGMVVAVDPATGLMGILDATGGVVVPCTYRNLRGYTGRRDFVEILEDVPDGGVRYLDRKGQPVNVPYSFIPDAFHGLAPVGDEETGLIGFLNEDFELVIPCLYQGYDTYFPEIEDSCVVLYKEGVGTGLLDTQGNFTIPEGWDGVERRTQDCDLLVVSKGEQQAVIQRKTGKVVIPPGTYDHIEPQQGDSGGFFVVYDLIGTTESNTGSKVGVVDLEGNVVVPVEYDGLWAWDADYVFSGTCFVVRKETGTGLLDFTGKELLPCEYYVDQGGYMHSSGPYIQDVLHQVYPDTPEYVYTSKPTYQDGLTSWSETGADGVQRWGLKDEKGEPVTPAIFDSMGDCMFRGYAVVSKDGVYGLLKNPLFKDKTSDWAADEVAEAREKGLVTQRTGTYMTYDITRLQFAELAVNLAEQAIGRAIEPAAADRFTDTADLAARKAGLAGIVNGTGDGSAFSPDELIDREQIAAMLYRAETYIRRERDGLGFTPLPPDLSGYTDAAQVSNWAVQAVGHLTARGILKGTSATTLSPQEATTVEQAVLLVLRASGV